MFKYKHYTTEKNYDITAKIANINLGLTVCSYYDKDNQTLKVGYSVFNYKDKHFIKKIGNDIARERCEMMPIVIDLKNEMSDINHFYLSWLSLLRIEYDMMHDKKYNIKFSPTMMDYVVRLRNFSESQFTSYLMHEYGKKIDQFIFNQLQIL